MRVGGVYSGRNPVEIYVIGRPEVVRPGKFLTTFLIPHEEHLKILYVTNNQILSAVHLNPGGKTDLPEFSDQTQTHSMIQSDVKVNDAEFQKFLNSKR
jgi:hypothetical protein